MAAARAVIEDCQGESGRRHSRVPASHHHFFFARVRAALRAAAERSFAPLVRAPFFAAAERWLAVRLRAALRACFESAFFDAAEWPSRFNALLLARERLAEVRFEDDFFAADFFDAVFLPPFDFFAASPFFGTFTPARRASDNPIAIACSVERAPCLPSRTCSISSRTNSPAWVLADLPSRLSFFARAIASLSGMSHLLARLWNACAPGRACVPASCARRPCMSRRRGSRARKGSCCEPKAAALNLDLRAEFDQAIAGNMEERGGRHCVARQEREQLVAPQRHARTLGGNHGFARQEERRVHHVEAQSRLRAGRERRGHVGIFHEAEAQRQRVERM